MENGQFPQITSMNEIEPPEFAAALRRAEAEFLEMPGFSSPRRRQRGCGPRIRRCAMPC